MIEMKRLLQTLMMLMLALHVSAQSYDYDRAELIANRLKAGQSLTANQYVEAVNLFVAGWQEVKAQGERLLEMTPGGSDWLTFHRSFEAIEDNYYAVWKILKELDKNVNKIPEKSRALFTRNQRAYKTWYKEFEYKQRKLNK